MPPKPTADLEDTIDRIPDEAPMLETRDLRAGASAETSNALIGDYLAAQPTLPRVGEVLADRWRIERMLGEGGFGAVFEGRDQQLGRKVAIKVMRADTHAPSDARAMREALSRMEERRRRFRDEARAVARAESDNVVTVYDVGEHAPDDGPTRWPFLVLELVDGTPLDRVVRERPTLEAALRILMQLAQGVATLHERRVVHRDLKPANAILTPDGRVKIIDFGLAVASSDWTEIKGPRPPTDWVEGTPLYMSPEVSRGEEPDEHADLWALGVIAYELVTGRAPWGQDVSLLELERRIAHEDPAPIVPRRPSDAPYVAHLTPIIMKMLARDRADRYQRASDVVAALTDLRARTTRTPVSERETLQPFRYLLAFEEKDAAWFFGREHVTTKLVLALEQRGRLVLAGPSGAGKTSVIQAGLIPELKVLRPLEVLRLHPGPDPLARLAAIVPGSPALGADDLRRQPGLVGERLRQHVKQTKTRVLVQVDALEELITQDAPPADVETFAHALAGLRDDVARGVLLVMAVRDEYLGRLPRVSPTLASALRDAEFLGPPSRAAMLAALTRPVARCGYTWEPGLPEEMVDAVADQASPLPVLQLAASWVWERRAEAGASDASILTRASLAAPGEALRIGEVLGQYADHKLRAASWSSADRELVKRMLPVMVSAEGAPLTTPIDEILARCPDSGRGAARGKELLRDLVDFRLLTSLRDERARECLTPVHTTLIRGWALWREALEGSAELEAFLGRFTRDAREWQASERDPAKLWPPAAARDFDRWASRLAEVRLEPAQVAFRAAVIRHARRARRLRWGLVAILAAVAIGATLAGFAFSAQADEANALRHASEEHRREADELIDFMLGDLRHRLEPLGQVKLLRSVAEKARDYLARREGDDPVDRRRRAAVLRNLAAVFLSEGDTEAADEAAHAALAIVRALAEAAPDDPEAQRDLARSNITLGHMLVERGDPTAALEHYRAAERVLGALLAKDPSDPKATFDTMVVSDRMGDVLARLGELEVALTAQRAAVAAAERLAAAEPESPRARRNVLITRSKIGAAPSAFGDWLSARFTEADHRAFEALAQANPQSGMAQYDLMLGKLGRANDLMAEGDVAQAITTYRAALAVISRVHAAEPDNVQHESDVAFCHNRLGDALKQSGDAPGAVREHEAALAIMRRLAAADPANVRFARDLAQTWTRLGDARLAAGDTAGALAAHDAALTIADGLAQGPAPSPDARIALARTLGFSAEALIAHGDSQRARTHLQRARAITAELLARPEPPRAWRELDAWLAALTRKAL